MGILPRFFQADPALPRGGDGDSNRAILQPLLEPTIGAQRPHYNCSLRRNLYGKNKFMPPTFCPDSALVVGRKATLLSTSDSQKDL
jgi:hypothetical protein